MAIGRREQRPLYQDRQIYRGPDGQSTNVDVTTVEARGNGVDPAGFPWCDAHDAAHWLEGHFNPIITANETRIAFQPPVLQIIEVKLIFNTPTNPDGKLTTGIQK